MLFWRQDARTALSGGLGVALGLACLLYGCAAESGGGSDIDGGIAGSGGSGGYGGSGGRCVYEETPGTATITDVREVAPGIYSCPDGRDVRFDFTPDDPGRASASDHAAPLRVRGGAAPPASCLVANGIEVDATFTARRSDIVAGPCTPVMWELDVPNWELCWAQCYGG